MSRHGFVSTLALVPAGLLAGALALAACSSATGAGSTPFGAFGSGTIDPGQTVSLVLPVTH